MPGSESGREERVKDGGGQMLLDDVEVRERWAKYIL